MPATQEAPTILIFCDFDGTLTGLAGNVLVDTDFYNNLLITPGNYIGPLHPLPYLLAHMRKELTGDDPRRMTKSAVWFLKNCLQLNNPIKLVIISKNQKAYIEALLHYEGFNQDEIECMDILDVHDLQLFGKKGAAQRILEQHRSRAQIIDYVHIYDDYREDLQAMYEGALMHLPADHIYRHTALAGQFNWQAEWLTLQGHSGLK